MLVCKITHSLTHSLVSKATYLSMINFYCLLWKLSRNRYCWHLYLSGVSCMYMCRVLVQTPWIPWTVRARTLCPGHLAPDPTGSDNSSAAALDSDLGTGNQCHAPTTMLSCKQEQYL